jgi:hypothetical protein
MPDYRNDELWQQAQQDYVRSDGTPEGNLLRSPRAAVCMSLIETGDRDTAALLLKGAA